MLRDNVQYVEIRGAVPKLYELNGELRERQWTLEKVYKPVFTDFKNNHPDFIGVKLILAKSRATSEPGMFQAVKEATRMYQQYPGLVAGFDVIGREDGNRALSDFVDALLYPSQLDPPVYLPYFFHAGKTVWQETDTNYNLLDAVLLNTSRIGIGLALTKHPLLMQMVSDGQIAVEICPIAAQIYKLVDDLRNHPATTLLASGMPVVISSDGPCLWDALPLSHDFYVTFMALTGEGSGLATLKQLALNSIKYSAMCRAEKEIAMKKWTSAWNKFIPQVIEEWKNQTG